MHTIQKKPINEFSNFEVGDFWPQLDLIDDVQLGMRVDCFLDDLEQLRLRYLETGDKRYWKELIRWLPCGWMQKRTVTMSYENLLAMCSKGQRRFHKLTEWKTDFMAWARTLPYAQELIFYDELDEAEEQDAEYEDGWDKLRAAAEARNISAMDIYAILGCTEVSDPMAFPDPEVNPA